jgi:hypothetical protein
VCMYVGLHCSIIMIQDLDEEFEPHTFRFTSHSGVVEVFAISSHSVKVFRRSYVHHSSGVCR